MKNFSIFIGLALVMIAVSCNRPTKTTEKEVKAAEEVLFNADMSTNNEAIAGAIETFSKYAEENPDAENAAEYLFKALEVSVNTKQDPKQSIELTDRFLKNYPKSDKAPVALFMLASFVYEDQLQDLDQARAAYQRIVDDYADSPFAKDAAISIEHLGMTPEELIKMFESQGN